MSVRGRSFPGESLEKFLDMQTMVWWRPPADRRIGWRYPLRRINGRYEDGPWLVTLDGDPDSPDTRPGWWPWEEYRPSAKKVLADFERLATGWPGSQDLRGKTATLVGPPGEPAFGSLIETFVGMYGGLFEPGTYELTSGFDEDSGADTFGESLTLWNRELRFAAGVFTLWRAVELLSDPDAAYRGMEILREQWMKRYPAKEAADSKPGFRWWPPPRYGLGVPPRWRVDPDDEQDVLRGAFHLLCRLVSGKLRGAFDMRMIPGSQPELVYVPTALLGLIYGQLAVVAVQRFSGARTMHKRECVNPECPREAHAFFTTDRRKRYCSEECAENGRLVTARTRAQRYYDQHHGDVRDRKRRDAPANQEAGRKLGDDQTG